MTPFPVFLSLRKTAKAFRKCCEDSSHSKTVESFVAYAAKNNIIETGDIKKFGRVYQQACTYF
jgi:hypothetical protein